MWREISPSSSAETRIAVGGGSSLGEVIREGKRGNALRLEAKRSKHGTANEPITQSVEGERPLKGGEDSRGVLLGKGEYQK